MNILQGIILGFIQGVAEFLPISSSGHLLLTRNFFDLGEVPVLFDVLLHFATLIVVCIVFRERLIKIFAAIGRYFSKKTTDEDQEQLRLTGIIIVASVLTAAIGFGIKQLKIAEQPTIVYALFIVTGLILIGSKFIKWEGVGDYKSIGLKHGVLTGIAQGLGVFPGISRSGITITTARLSGMNREKAGEFSFVISIPAILGAMVLDLKDAGDLMSKIDGIEVLIISFITAFVVGMVSLILLLKLIKGGKFYLFSFYLIPMGIIGLIFL